MVTDPVGFSGHVEGSAFEFAEVLKEYKHKGCNVLRSFFCCALMIGSVPEEYSMSKPQTTFSPYWAYENPTPTGWSMKMTLAFEFHDSG